MIWYDFTVFWFKTGLNWEDEDPQYIIRNIKCINFIGLILCHLALFYLFVEPIRNLGIPGRQLPNGEMQTLLRS